jgi:acyl carrier protein
LLTLNDILAVVMESDLNIDPKELDPSTPLLEQGLDSLDLTTIFFDLEDKLGVYITDDTIEQGKVSSLNAIVSFINENHK